MKVKHLIEQLFNYDIDLPVSIAGRTAINRQQCNLDPGLHEVSKMFQYVASRENLDIVIIAGMFPSK